MVIAWPSISILGRPSVEGKIPPMLNRKGSEPLPWIVMPWDPGDVEPT